MESTTRYKANREQERLIQIICKGAMDRIETAGTKAQAEMIASEVCAQMEKDCQSPLVVSASRRYLHSRIEDHWGGDIEPRAPLP